MAAPDARTRRKISLKPARVFTGSIQNRLLPHILLSNVLFVVGLYSAKELLLSFDVGVFWVVMRILACGGLCMLTWEGLTGKLMKENIEWSALGVSSLLLFVQQATLYTALYRLSSTRVILFTHFSTVWVHSALRPASVWTSVALALALVISFISDTALSHQDMFAVLPGYGALALHAVSAYALEHMRGALSTTLSPRTTTAASTLGAALLGLPLYVFRKALLNLPPSPIPPLSSLAVLPLLTYNMIFLIPDSTELQYNPVRSSQTFSVSYPFAFLAAAVVGFLGFTQDPHWTDLLIAILLYYALFPRDEQHFTGTPRTPASRLIRFYIKSILSDGESRKIFYFLVLNMCYMLVQMLYGVWTNSLGLISDAIHMAFDCMAIGVGLIASIMSKWPPDERFTYGYGRIETLSGFANGIFLILISVFIVFEAIQRILDPPEMTTSQLLLISSLGLGVNLFGMFAMGGHHHHHHGHGHSHGHDDHSHGHDDHSHSHADHSHNHADHSHHHHHHDHSQGHNDHSHSHHDHAHSHSHNGHPHSHETHFHPHIHSHPTDDHLHSHNGHSHTHSHVAHSHASDDAKSHSYAEGGDHAVFHSQSHPDLHIHQHQDSSHSPTDHDHHSHSHSTSHSRTHSTSTQGSQKFEEGTASLTSTIRGRKPHSRGPSLHIPNDTPPPLQVPFPSQNLSGFDSPVSPNHYFKHDHDEKHHSSGYVPHSHVHSHGHGHSHEGHSHNMRGVFLHVMADTLGSVGVIVSTLLIQYYGWTGFDPIASLFIAILIVASVVPLVIDTGKVLCLDMGDQDSNVQRALNEIANIDGVVAYSSPKFWPKDSSSVIGSIHIQMAPLPSTTSKIPPEKRITVDRILEQINAAVRSRIPDLEEFTIQLEESKATA